MEQAQPPSRGKSQATLLWGDAGRKAARISGPLVLGTNLSDDDHRGSATQINPLNCPEKAPQKKPEPPRQNDDNTLATRGYGCKYCKAKFSTLQSLGGHQNAHRRERADNKRARVVTKIAKALSQVNLKSKPNCSGVRPNPVRGHPIANGTLTWPSPADVIGPPDRGRPEPVTTTNPQASASHRPSMVNWLIGMVYEPMNNGGPNFCSGVSPQSTGPRSPPASVLPSRSSFSTQEIEDEGLDLTLRL